MVEKFRLYPDGTVVHEDEFRECDERYEDFGTYVVNTEICLDNQPFLPEELISVLREEFESNTDRDY